MMRTMISSLPLAMIFLWAPAAAQGSGQCGTSFVETFGFFSNEGNWVFSGDFQASVSSGGNPSWHVLSQPLEVSTPRFQTTNPASTFGGDWRQRSVSSAGIDVYTHEISPAALGRPLVLALYHDNGTPFDPSDDPYVYTAAGQIPDRDGDWHSFAVDVASGLDGLPPGWSVGGPWTGSADALWNLVMGDVHRVAWVFGNPALGPQPAAFRFAVDNARLAFAGGPTSYCIAQQSSLGCSPSVGWLGSASETQPFPFLIRADQLRSQSIGMLIYGPEPSQIPLFGGYACVAQPLQRTAVLPTGGSPSGADCSGALSFDFNAHIQSGVDPLLVAGATVHVQFWSRDPGNPLGNASLSNAVRFTICP